MLPSPAKQHPVPLYVTLRAHSPKDTSLTWNPLPAPADLTTSHLALPPPPRLLDPVHLLLDRQVMVRKAEWLLRHPLHCRRCSCPGTCARLASQQPSARSAASAASPGWGWCSCRFRHLGYCASSATCTWWASCPRVAARQCKGARARCTVANW